MKMVHGSNAASPAPAILAAALEPALDPALMDELLSGVSEERRERVRRFARWEDAQRCLLGEILARISAREQLGIPDREIAFGRGEYGKPFLEGFPGFFHNVSHSGRWVVCAISPYPVGVDVETIRPIDLGLAARFFSPGENLDLMDRDPRDRQRYFYDLWTLKESYIKAVGKGLYMPLESFTVRKTEGLFALEDGGGCERCAFAQYPLDAEHVLSACSSHRSGLPAVVTGISFSEACGRFLRGAMRPL